MSNIVQGLIWKIEFPNGLAKLIALKLGDNASDEGDNIFPSNTTTAWSAGCAKSTVCKVQAAMEHCGMLRTVNRSAGGNSRETSRRAYDMDLLRRLHWPNRKTPSELILREVEIERPALRDDGTPDLSGDAPKMVKVTVYEIVPRVAPVRDADPSPVRVTDGSEGDPSAGRTPTGPSDGSTRPSHGHKPFTNPSVEPFDSLSPLPLSTLPLVGESENTWNDLIETLPQAHRLWLEDLLNDGVHLDVVEHFIAPLIEKLGLPPSAVAPVPLLRDLRDRAAQAQLTPRALRKAADILRQGRAKLPVKGEEIDEPIKQARLHCRYRIEAGDPRWEAWLTRWAQNPEGMTISIPSRFRRMREGFLVDDDWPPDSAEVDETPDGFLIPWGTPEYSAWLCHLRGDGQHELAQSHDAGKLTLREKTRWPELRARAGRAA